MIKYFTGLFLTLFVATGVLAQPTITITDAEGEQGDIVSVDLKVKDFKNIVSFMFTVTFDPNKLKVRSVKNITGKLAGWDEQWIDYSPINADRGYITSTFVNVTEDDGYTLPDGESLYTIEFEIIGGGNSTAKVDIPESVEFGEYDRVVEVLDKEFENIGLKVNSGTITIGGEPGMISLSLGSASGKNGETVCIPITVNNFNGVTAMQFSIAFDPDFMDFVEAKNFDLPGFSSNSVSAEQVSTDKALIVTWNTADGDPIDKPNGTKIVDLCFKIKKSSGSSDVRFSDNPSIIELTVPDGDGGVKKVDGNLSNGRITAGSGDGGGGDVECDLSGFYIAGSHATSPKGSEVCVDIVGTEINRFGILQTVIEWDPEVLTNPSFESGKIELDPGFDYSLDQSGDGRAILSWTYDGMDQKGVTAEDHSVLFKMCFEVIGEDGDQTDIAFTEDDHTFQLAGTVDGDPIDFQACDGSVTVGEADPVSVNTKAPTCFGDKDGSITLRVSGGQSPYTYTWKKDGETIGATATLNNLAAGKYSYTVVDNTGKEMGSGEVNLKDPDEIKIEGDIKPVESGADGAIEVTVSGGDGDYIYSWSNGDDSKNIDGLESGSYTLTVTDGTGCSANHTFDLGEGEFNVKIESTRDYNGFDISCNGESDASLRAVASFGNAPYEYKWSTGDDTESIQNVGGGKYSVTVTDSDGNSAKGEYEVNEPGRVVVRVVTTPSYGGNAGTAKAEVRGGAEPFKYQWNDKSPGSTTVFIGSLTEGSYRVSVEDANGCAAMGVGQVYVDDRECYTAVKIMTPNADGLNDELRIACVEGTFNMLRVFDRWGRLVYQEENYDNNWTGIDRDGNALGDGVYYFVLEIDDGDGIDQYKGHVTLLRDMN